MSIRPPLENDRMNATIYDGDADVNDQDLIVCSRNSAGL